MLTEEGLKRSVVNNLNIYHLSETNLDGSTLSPRIPNNYMTKNGYEDNKTPSPIFDNLL